MKKDMHLIGLAIVFFCFSLSPTLAQNGKNQGPVTLVKGALFINGKAVKEVKLQDGTIVTANQITKMKGKVTITGKAIQQEGKNVTGSVVTVAGQAVQGFTLRDGVTVPSENHCACVLPPIGPPPPEGTKDRRKTAANPHIR